MSEAISIVSEQKMPYGNAAKFISIEAYYKAEEKSLTKHEYMMVSSYLWLEQNYDITD